ncbi:hypothetical protein PM082_011720 [Marasmius tenuissimus]|nr:hypothetical protein PM082_011720 [Marasmius tenuissimus]
MEGSATTRCSASYLMSRLEEVISELFAARMRRDAMSIETNLAMEFPNFLLDSRGRFELDVCGGQASTTRRGLHFPFQLLIGRYFKLKGSARPSHILFPPLTITIIWADDK